MENNAQVYATVEGKRKLEKKLESLISRRAEVAEQIKVAREFGDLKENAEYAAAREAQNLLEADISSIEEMLTRIKTFSYSKADVSKVSLGTRVKLENVANKAVVEYVITGVLESDIEKGYLSNESPIGSALLGKQVKEEVEIKVPAGKIRYKIVKITAGA